MDHISVPDVNRSALTYWSIKGYSAQDFFDVCADLDSTYMIAVFSFNGSGDVEMRLSRRTWERQEGHYPSVAKYFAVVAHHPVMHGVKGNIAVWLEDGLWEWNHPLSRKVPLFTFGRHVDNHYALLMPDPSFINAQGYGAEIEAMRPVAHEFPWEERIQTVFWRGAASGLGMDHGEWMASPRSRLVLRAKELGQPTLLDALFTRLSHLPPERQEEILALGVAGQEVPFQDFYRYKYMVDVDGYSCAWRSLFLKLATGSLVLKVQSPYMQWFYPHMKPWKHYIPVSADLSDITDVYEWLVNHDSQVKQIARQGEEFITGIEYFHSVGEVAHTCRTLIAAQRQG